MKIESNPDSVKEEDLIQLYLECFSTGTSEQFIDSVELKKYLKSFYLHGAILSIQDQEKLVGALLALPLSYDKLFPENLRKNYDSNKTWYIAELMITEDHRAKGLGKELLNEFFKNAELSEIKDVIIRVWDENYAALNLYRKIGFEEIASIFQTKTKADLSGTFQMKKIYMHKKVTSYELQVNR